jgi:glycosyltransferase involved in cell wall biosynthesis
VREAPSRLRVAVDATPLLGFRTGVGVFCQHALEALVERSELEMSGFAVSWRRRGGIRGQLPQGVRVIDRPMPARPLHRAWSRRPWPPLEWFTGPQEVVHGTNFVVPPTRRAAQVLTIHDLTPVRFPELCDDYTRTFPAQVRLALRRGAWVHTPSRFVAEEVVDLLGANPARVRPVHHGVPPLPAPTAPGPPPVTGPFVLALGTIEPRKDLPSLVRAFDLMAAEVPEVSLVVAGADGWGTEAFAAAVRQAAHRGRIVRLGYVDTATRSALMATATVFAYPSLYEGFGFPPLEAMSMGVPVVTTDAGALPEVLEDAALTVPVGDPERLGEALRVLVEDEGRREAVIAAGYQRVGRFSWARAGAGLAALYADAWAEARPA